MLARLTEEQPREVEILFNITMHSKEQNRLCVKRWRQNNRKREQLNASKYRERNREKIRSYEQVWRLNNPDRARNRYNKWAHLHPEKCAARAAQRYAVKLNATPSWLTPEMRRDIEFMYKIRAEMLNPSEWEIDHYYPLQGKDAKGLHVPWNLRLLKKEDNAKKFNKMPDPLPLYK